MESIEETWGALELTEREWLLLVRRCARWPGAPDVAEDLAQETLIEAWRQAHKLVDPRGRDRWLARIAHYVCLRWARKEARMAARRVPLASPDMVVDPNRVSSDIERREMTALVVQALAQLPPAARRILIARYWYDHPYHTIAAQLDLSPDVVAMRLSRARKQLKQVLATDLRIATAAYMPAAMLSEAWHSTRLWCRMCGQHHLLVQIPRTSGAIAFRCPGCNPDPAIPGSAYPLNNQSFGRLFGGLQRPTVILRRAAAWARPYFQEALARGVASCTHCNRAIEFNPTESKLPSDENGPFHLVSLSCNACGTTVSTSFRGLLSVLPEVQAFGDTQRRVRLLPERAVDVLGQAATVTRVESLTSTSYLDVIALQEPTLLLETYQVSRDGRGPGC